MTSTVVSQQANKGGRLLLNVGDYEAAARAAMPPQHWDFYAGGAEDEVSLGDNQTAFDAWRLRPRVLVDVRNASPATSALGIPIDLPVLVGPSAYQTMAHSEGELATARGAAAAGTIMIVSVNSGYTLEHVAAAAPGPKWLQLYIYGGDLAATLPLVQRAEDAGYQALVLTVDRPVYGRRERDLRNEFSLPPGVRAVNFADADRKALASPCEITWDTVDELTHQTALPVLLKGILTGEDAALAVDHGIAGVMVSNHGGRQLDGVCTGMHALPEVVAAVDGQCEVFVDGGVRRGTDVLKALALGAQAVLVGRPALWGLAVDGADGVAAVLGHLHKEIVTDMKLLGRPSCAAIDASAVVRV